VTSPSIRDDLPIAAQQAWARVVAPGASKDDRTAALDAAFDAVDFPQRETAWEPFVLPAALTTPQRALAILTSTVDDLPLAARSLPQQAWCRRRWLGLDPPGPFERPVPFADGGEAGHEVPQALENVERVPEKDAPAAKKGASKKTTKAAPKKTRG
jgi:hypothetical protein